MFAVFGFGTRNDPENGTASGIAFRENGHVGASPIWLPQQFAKGLGYRKNF